MRQTPYSQNQRQRNGNYSAFRTSGSLISSTVAAICCLMLAIGAIAGMMYSDSYFEPWVKTTATIVGVEKREVEVESNNSKGKIEVEYCPEIQFFTVGEATVQNITTVLETCHDDAEEVVVGNPVAIRYDPSDPKDVIEAIVPDIIEAVATGVIAVTAFCSCCCLAIGVHFYKATKASNNNSNNHHGQHQTTYPYENNHSTPTSTIPMTNLGGNRTEYTGASAPYSNNTNAYATSEPFGNNTYTASAPVETSASAVFVSPNEAQSGSAPSMVSALPEGTTENTGIAAGEVAPPIVGCTLVPDNNAPVTQTYPRSGSETYVSPSSLPLNPVTPTSSYVSPSDIHEARATLDRQYQ
mmetsp:Transcript_7257/g.17064  ORF Transcript_7257/g.17064 Transcript_7257/m.17064 type:complete len:354 (-) Transcript_7257:122-1183(-)